MPVISGGSVVVTLDPSGTLLVDGSTVTQPVSAVSLPLPTGASTESTAQAELSALNEIAWQAILAGERMMFQ